MARLILDSGVLIGIAREQLDLPVWAETDDLALPAVVIAEYLEGVILTTNEARRAQHRAFLDRTLSMVTVIDYTSEIAEHHAVLLAHTRRAGQPRGVHDLIIAATARAADRTILTRDARARFDELPGVQARAVSPPAGTG